jgi:GTP-binding protein EngB required for normal cell division
MGTAASGQDLCCLGLSWSALLASQLVVQVLNMLLPATGKTRCINHFLINNNWYLVDLPGYG